MSLPLLHVLGDHIHLSRKADNHHWVYLNAVFYNPSLACIAGRYSGEEFPASKVPAQRFFNLLV